MPTISRFYGIAIGMFFDEHAPPHFHAKYAEYEASIDIRNFSLLRGKLPPKALSLVVDGPRLISRNCWKTGNLRCNMATSTRLIL